MLSVNILVLYHSDLKALSVGMQIQNKFYRWDMKGWTGDILSYQDWRTPEEKVCIVLIQNNISKQYKALNYPDEFTIMREILITYFPLWN